MTDAELKETFKVLAKKTMKNRTDCLAVWTNEGYRQKRIKETLAKYPSFK